MPSSETAPGFDYTLVELEDPLREGDPEAALLRNAMKPFEDVRPLVGGDSAPLSRIHATVFAAKLTFAGSGNPGNNKVGAHERGERSLTQAAMRRHYVSSSSVVSSGIAVSDYFYHGANVSFCGAVIYSLRSTRLARLMSAFAKIWRCSILSASRSMV